MYHDLNVCVGVARRPEAVRLLESLGYHTIAFTTEFRDVKKLGDEHRPIKLDTSPKPNAHRLLHTDPTQRTHGVKILYRATLYIDDASQLPVLSSSILKEYDIVAVCPSSDKLLQQCLKAEVDIVALPLERRSLFFTRRQQLHVAVNHGVHFEVSYALALRDVQARRHLICNTSALSRASSGKHLVFSSGARTLLELRGPHDIINLGIIFEVPQQPAHDAVTSNAAASVAHGHVRGKLHKGIVLIEKVERSEPVAKSEDTMDL